MKYGTVKTLKQPGFARLEVVVMPGTGAFSFAGVDHVAGADSWLRVKCALFSQGYAVSADEDVVASFRGSCTTLRDHHDAAIAAAYLVATGQADPACSNAVFLGKVALSGEVDEAGAFELEMLGRSGPWGDETFVALSLDPGTTLRDILSDARRHMEGELHG